MGLIAEQWLEQFSWLIPEMYPQSGGKVLRVFVFTNFCVMFLRFEQHRSKTEV